jgi:hypothetical protein
MGKTSTTKAINHQNRDIIAELLKADAIKQTISLGMKVAKGDNDKLNNEDEFPLIQQEHKSIKQ